MAAPRVPERRVEKEVEQPVVHRVFDAVAEEVTILELYRAMVGKINEMEKIALEVESSEMLAVILRNAALLKTTITTAIENLRLEQLMGEDQKRYEERERVKDE